MSMFLGALSTNASASTVPSLDAKQRSVLKKSKSSISQGTSKNPGKSTTTTVYSSIFSAALGLPPVPFKDGTTLPLSDGGSVRSKLKKAPRSDGAAASASTVLAVGPDGRSSATGSNTKGRSVLKKSASRNSFFKRAWTPFSSTTGLRCVVCRVNSASSEYSGVTCSLTCIEKFCHNGHTDSHMCDVCHRRPKPQGQRECGQTCVDAAKVACLVCKLRPKDGKQDLCSLVCKKVAMKLAPFILEVPRNHTVFDTVEMHFKRAWKGSSTSIPTIRRVFKIIEDEDFQRPYDLYRKRIGPEECFRYHGTKRQCKLGILTKTFCTASSCAVCSILKRSFRVDVANPSGAFGKGIYTSSASSKAYDFCNEDGALLLNKVVLGKVRQVSQWGEVKRCPEGYNSVVFEHKNGTRNETILYSDDAIRPVFLIMFQ